MKIRVAITCQNKLRYFVGLSNHVISNRLHVRLLLVFLVFIGAL